MLRATLGVLLWLLAVSAIGADAVLYYAPDGSLLKPGSYQKVEIQWRNGKPEMVTSVILTIGGDVPPPPPPDDLPAKVAGLLASVTADPTKAETAKGLSEAYRQVLAGQSLLNGKPDVLRKVAETLIDQLLASPQVGKTATWKPFTDGMKSLAAPLDFAGVVNLYTIAQTQLGGGVVPPPPPPPPVSTVTRAVVIEESGDRTPEQAAILTDPRLAEAKKAGRLLVLDQDAKDSSGKPAVELSQLDGPLPRLIGLGQDGRRSVGVELPATADEFVGLLESWGVK